MKESNGPGEHFPLPPNRLFERLAQIGSTYTWDQSIEPYHSVSFQVMNDCQSCVHTDTQPLELRQLACLRDKA